jgi:hypothetical protein
MRKAPNQSPEPMPVLRTGMAVMGKMKSSVEADGLR